MITGKILIVDDEEQLRKLLTRIVSLEGFAVSEAGTLKDALAILHRQSIDVILCDVRLPDGNGVDFVQTLKASFPVLEIIVLTAYGNIADGVKAIKNGAFDYITKGDDNDRIIPLLHQAIDQVSLHIKAAIKISDASVLNFWLYYRRECSHKKFDKTGAKNFYQRCHGFITGRDGYRERGFCDSHS